MTKLKLDPADFNLVDELTAELHQHDTGGLEITWYENGEVVGSATLLIQNRQVIWQNLQFVERWQGKRLLSRIMHDLLPMWRKHAIERYVIFDKDNSPEAREMYIRLGFVYDENHEALYASLAPGNRMEMTSRKRINEFSSNK